MTLSYVIPLWERTGLVVWRKGEPTMERELPLGAWRAPSRIELDEAGDRLVWWGGDYRRVDDDEGVLTAFVRLAGADDRSLLDYARRYGVLELCEHGIPRSHRPAASLAADGAYAPVCLPVRLDGGDEPSLSPALGPYAEPLAAWRSLAAQVRAVVNLGALLRAGEPGSPQEWGVALGRGPDATTAFNGIDLADLRSPWVLAYIVQALLELGNVRPLFRWEGERGYGIAIGAPANHAVFGMGLFGAIATQLAFALARSEGLAVCSGCGNAYSLREGRARTGTNRYCKACRDAGVPARERQRQLRRRRKDGSA